MDMTVLLKFEDGSTARVPDDDVLPIRALYGYKSMANAYKPKVFPRTDKQRIERMNRYVEWKRQKVREKWVNRVVAGIVAYFGVVILIVGMSYANRLLFHAVLS
jgi:hypothetical protein